MQRVEKNLNILLDDVITNCLASLVSGTELNYGYKASGIRLSI
jgi:hypothetical protein